MNEVIQKIVALVFLFASCSGYIGVWDPYIVRKVNICSQNSVEEPEIWRSPSKPIKGPRMCVFDFLIFYFDAFFAATVHRVILIATKIHEPVLTQATKNLA